MSDSLKVSSFGLALSAALLAAAPLFLPDSYSVITHTTSESAAQGVPWAWVARSGLMLFGVSALLMATEPAVTRSALAKWSFGFFGLCLALSAVASTRPWIEGAPFDPLEDAVHSVAATAMGFAFAAGVLATAFDRSGRPGRGMAAIHSLTLVASVAIPLAMFSYPAIAGVLQRIMFVVAYAWFAVRLARRNLAPASPTGTLLSH